MNSKGEISSVVFVNPNFIEKRYAKKLQTKTSTIPNFINKSRLAL